VKCVGAGLLDRSPQGIEPTACGRALLRRGVATFDELKQGVKDIEFLSDPSAGELRIGTGTGLAEWVVLAVIDRMSRQHPRVVFHIVPGGRLELYDELHERRIDLGFAGISGPHSEGDIEVELLFSEPLVVVAGIKNPWVRRRKIDLVELVNERWTWSPPGGVLNALVVEAFRARGLKAQRATVYARTRVGPRVTDLCHRHPFLLRRTTQTSCPMMRSV
jgi:DNA-binding transcriptional LysR family regulator